MFSREKQLHLFTVYTAAGSVSSQSLFAGISPGPFFQSVKSLWYRKPSFHLLGKLHWKHFPFMKSSPLYPQILYLLIQLAMTQIHGLLHPTMQLLEGFPGTLNAYKAFKTSRKLEVAFFLSVRLRLNSCLWPLLGSEHPLILFCGCALFGSCTNVGSLTTHSCAHRPG